MDKPRAPAIGPGPWRTLRPSPLRPSPLRGVPEVIPRGALAPGKGVRAKPGTERACGPPRGEHLSGRRPSGPRALADREAAIRQAREDRSEEHTSELQSRLHLVCRLLL